jgi:hypothetical protein
VIGDQTGETHTCLESFKTPGRYHANMIPCMSTRTQGLEMEDSAAGQGGYFRLKLFSASRAAFVPEFPAFFGSLSA